MLLPHIKGGKVKALAVTGPQRDPQIPNVPTVRELGLGGVESVGFQGLVGPAGMPPEIISRISTELGKVLTQTAVKEKFITSGAEVHPLDAATFADFVKKDNAKWSALIQQRNLTLD